MEASLEQNIRDLHYIYTLISQYSNNEIELQKTGVKHNKIKSSIEPKLVKCNALSLALLKTDLQFIKNNIRFYFNKLQDKKENEGNSINNNIEELNNEYKKKEALFIEKFKELNPLFMSSEQPYPVIINSIITDKDVNIIIDVIKHYYLNKSGAMSAKECIKHGIKYTEKDTQYPKGLFDGMLA